MSKRLISFRRLKDICVCWESNIGYREYCKNRDAVRNTKCCQKDCPVWKKLKEEK